MGRSNRDVGGYRGRRTITDILRFIAITLAVTVVLVLAGVVYLQRYVVYTEEGAKLELPPFLEMLRQKDDGTGPEGSASIPDLTDISIIEGDVSGQEDPEPEPESAGFALQVSVDEVLNGAAAAKLEETGAEALVVEVKDQLGRLSWHTEQTIAERAEINGQQSVGDALRQWNQGDVYTIARVHCFRDDTVPYYNNNLALRWAGTEWNWRDDLGLRWTSPAKEGVRTYNAALCGELAAMGFDEIVLEEFYFPIDGKLDTIRRGEAYDSSQFAAQVEAFLEQVRQAVEPYGTKVSLRVGRATLAGEESVSGVSLPLLERYAFRIWTDEEGWNALRAQSGELAEQAVKIVAQAEEGGILFQAVIPEEEAPKPIV